MLSKEAHDALFREFAERSTRGKHPVPGLNEATYAIAYALLCIHETMQQQAALDAADHAEADQITMDWTTTVKGGN